MPHLTSRRSGIDLRVLDLTMKTTAELRREQADFRRDRAKNGRIRYMAHADGYVMVRRPRSIPFVMTETEWRQLPYLGTA